MLSRIGNGRLTYLSCPAVLDCRVWEFTGNVRPVVPAGDSPLAGGSDGPVVAGGPAGPWETLSPSSEEALEPLEHAVLIHADPAGQHAAVGTLSPSDCYPAGPAGPYVTGGPD